MTLVFTIDSLPPPLYCLLCVSFLRTGHWIVGISAQNFKDNLYVQWPLSKFMEISAWSYHCSGEFPSDVTNYQKFSVDTIAPALVYFNLYKKMEMTKLMKSECCGNYVEMWNGNSRGG